MAGLLYESEGEQVLSEIEEAFAQGRPTWVIAGEQDCDPLDITSIASSLRRKRRDVALSTARAIYGRRAERRKAVYGR